MGGGDLNLKKSWHPSTLRNIERVWKAEQKHEAEQQKIEQLQKELAAERAREEIHAYGEDQGVLKKRNERLDWMYQGPAALVNRDDYLMGRKIDKTLELLEMQENGQNIDKDVHVGSIFRPEASTSTVTVDLANKIKEDPLFAIMKKEKEQRKNLLNNPVKMKQLKQMLEKSLSKEKKGKNCMKRKKEKKRPHQSSSSSYSSDSDEKRSAYKHKEREYEQKHSKSKHQHVDHDSRRKRNDSYNHEKHVSRKHRNEDTEDERHYKKYRISDERSASIKREHSRDLHHYNNHSSNSNKRGEVKKALSSAEKERLRQEMMENAKWREEHRRKNVERYIKEGELEDNVGKGNASNFIRPMLSKAAELGSVESRVKQKIFTIQRRKGDMDKNFARR